MGHAWRALLASLLVNACPAFAADAASSDGFGPPRWLTGTAEARGVERRVFESSAARAKVSYHVYRPAAYEREKDRRFPVVYWLHGSGGGEPGIPRVAWRFDAAIEAGKLPPCLVVFVNGLEMGMYVDWADGTRPMETQIVRELVPHIDAAWRTVARREGRLLEGFSMGGYGAARLGFKFPEVFGAVSMLGAGPLQERLERTPRASPIQAEALLRRAFGGDQARFAEASPRRWAEANAARLARDTPVRMVVGEGDETLGNNRDFHELLTRLGIPHGWQVVPGVGHEPERLTAALGDAGWEFHRLAFGRLGAERRTQEEVRLSVAPGVERRALVFNTPREGVRPAVLVLHGGMGSAARMRATSGFDRLAEREGFIAVYPEGTDYGQGRHAWNTGHLLRRQVRDADDLGFLDALIDHLVAERGADPTRIYLTGGSNGGMMSFVYAAARPGRLAAVAPVVASMFTFDRSPDVPLPILIINGGKDEEVPLGGGMSGNPRVRGAQAMPFKPIDEVVAFWAKANRCVGPPMEKVEGSVVTRTFAPSPGGAVVEQVLDREGGHGWPGGTGRPAATPPIGSFSGAERVWAFLRDKSRPSAR